MIILLIVLSIVIACLFINTISYENHKDKELSQQLKEKVLSRGWKYLDEDIFSGKLSNGVIWKVRKEEGEAIWFIDSIYFTEEHLWVLARKRTFIIDFSSSIAQFFLTLSHGKDEAQKLANLKQVNISNAEFNRLFVVLATNDNLVKNILNDDIVILLNNWHNNAKNKQLPKIILSKKGLEIKLHLSSLDFPTLNKIVELGETILNVYRSSYNIRYKSD